MASMMTGLYPSQHGLNRADRALGRDLVTLPQRLAELLLLLLLLLAL